MKIIMPCHSSLLIFLCMFTVTSGTGSEILLGHMKPFGAHMPPGTVDEVTDETMPSPQKFWTEYMSKRKPLVFRGAAKHSPSMTKWTDEYLKNNYGDLEVRLEAKKEKQGYIPHGDVGLGRDTIRNFVNTYHTRNKYVVSELPYQMYHEVKVMPMFTCGSISQSIVEVDWWMNGGNASSIIHKDAFNQINCLMNGTKEWKLIEHKYEKEIYKAWEDERQIGGYSRINPNKVDMIKYPKVATVPWMSTKVHGGDCLYLPGSMYHQVKSNGSHNFAVSLLFSRFDNVTELDFSDCPKDLSYKKLSNLDVQWQYPGNGTMTMGAPDLGSLGDYIVSATTDEKGAFHPKYLLDIVQSDTSPNKDAKLVKKDVIKALRKVKEITGEKKLNRTIIENLPKKALRILSLLLQPMDASNTYDHEYTYIRPEVVKNLINKFVSKGKQIERQTFVYAYMKEAFGSEKFGNRLFDIFAGESANVATVGQLESKVEEAVKKYSDMQRSEEEPPAGETNEGDAYDSTNYDTEMYETGMPDMTDGDDDNGSDEPSEENTQEKQDEEDANETSMESKDEL